MLCVKKNERYDCKNARQIKKKTMQCMRILNAKNARQIKKKIWSKTQKLKIFQFRSVEHRLNTNRVRQRAMIKNQGIFNRSKNTFDRSKFQKFEFFEKQQKIMQKPLNPNNFMNEMHENEFKSFSKTLILNPELQNKIF